MQDIEPVRSATIDFDRNLALSACVLALNLAVAAVALFRLLRLSRARRAAERGDWQALSSQRVSTRLEWIAGGSLFAMIVAFASSLRHARSLMPSLAISKDNPVEVVAPALARGFEAQLNTLTCTAFMVPLPLTLGLFALVLARSARQYCDGLQRAAQLADRQPSAAHVWLRVPGPSLMAALAWCSCLPSMRAFRCGAASSSLGSLISMAWATRTILLAEPAASLCRTPLCRHARHSPARPCRLT